MPSSERSICIPTAAGVDAKHVQPISGLYVLCRLAPLHIISGGAFLVHLLRPWIAHPRQTATGALVPEIEKKCNRIRPRKEKKRRRRIKRRSSSFLTQPISCSALHIAAHYTISESHQSSDSPSRSSSSLSGGPILSSSVQLRAHAPCVCCALRSPSSSSPSCSPRPHPKLGSRMRRSPAPAAVISRARVVFVFVFVFILVHGHAHHRDLCDTGGDSRAAISNSRRTSLA